MDEVTRPPRSKYDRFITDWRQLPPDEQAAAVEWASSAPKRKLKRHNEDGDCPDCVTEEERGTYGPVVKYGEVPNPYGANPVEYESLPILDLQAFENRHRCGAPEDPCLECQRQSDIAYRPLWSRLEYLERRAVDEINGPVVHSTSEVKVIDPVTGGAKGTKGWTFDDMPADALITLAKVYAMGAEKYGRANYKLGYAWSLTFSALQRHLWLFWAGEDDDPESGLPHLAHAAWHCLTLLHFLQQVKGTDDR